MKKKISVVLLVLLVVFTLFGCRDNQNQSSDIEKLNSSEISQKEAEYTPYINSDDTKSKEYNDAIKAYNEFLNGKIDATDKNTNNTININEMTNINNLSGIGSFALFDMNWDGIPELLTRSLFYDVFSYQNNQVLHWYNSFNIMNGPTTVLSNGAIFSTHDSTGTEYHYTTFTSDGATNTIKFQFVFIDYDKIEYYFQTKKVLKKEYDSLTKKYMELSKKPAAIQWVNYQ